MVWKGQVLLLAAVVALALVAAGAAQARATHSSPCHLKKACPSDHASYRWKGLLCVKPASPKRNATFKRRVTYSGRVYYCKR